MTDPASQAILDRLDDLSEQYNQDLDPGVWVVRAAGIVAQIVAAQDAFSKREILDLLEILSVHTPSIVIQAVDGAVQEAQKVRNS